MKIISIANQKGGCGKTTTAINLASALSLNGKRVLLFDLDPQAHASLGLDIESQDSIYNVISKLTPRKLRIENIIKRVENNFDIAPSNILVGTLEQELADEIGRELKLKEALAPVKDQYDYVLIDCPPSLGILTVNAIRASDEMIIPVETSRFSVQGVDHLIEIVNLVKDRLNHEVKCRILMTMFDSRLRHSFSMLDKIRERFGRLLYGTIVHVNVKLKESAVMGQTVATYDKYCRGSKDYNSLAKEMIAIDNGQATEVAATQASKPAAKKAPKRATQVQAEEQRAAQPQAEELLAQSGAREDPPRVEAADTQSFQPMSEKMRETIARESKDLLTMIFTLNAPGARSVYVTGSFNDWSLDDSCRMREADGRWEVDIPLRKGVHKYQFIVDGVWKEDPNNSRKERNSFGDINSLIEVGDEHA